MSERKNAGVVTAYGAAVQGGYEGTYEQFCALLADLPEVINDLENMTVDVSTLSAGSSATASYADGVLTLGIPKGDKGDKGDKGNKGDTGATPAFTIGTVTTGAAGTDAAATITGTAAAPVLNLTIPKGADGAVPAAAIAGTEATTTASKAYAVGDRFFLGGTLYIATAPIASGGTITVSGSGANCKADVLGDDVSELKTALNGKDPLFDLLIHLPDNDSFFNKTGLTGTATYTKISHNQFQFYGGSGTTYHNYPLHGTSRVVTGTDAQIVNNVNVSDFAPIPEKGYWSSTGASLALQSFYTNTDTSNNNFAPRLILMCANIESGAFVDTPVIVSTNAVLNGLKYGYGILRLRDFGFAPLEKYTHYALFASSRRRTITLKQTYSLYTSEDNTFNSYFANPSYNNVEISTTASKNYSINDLILYNAVLYKVTTPITSGSTIVTSGSGANVVQTTALAEISNVYKALTAILTCFQHTAWEDANGSTYIGALENLIT